MKCRKCGRDLEVGAKFCMFCGTKVGIFCPKCETELPNIAGVRFCFKCGTEVNPVVKKQPSKPQNTQALNNVVKKQPSKPQNTQVLNNEKMEQLSSVMKKNDVSSGPTGLPVWDITPTGHCDCAVGECDCDGSIWN